MTPADFHAARKTLATPFGQIAYVECGEGPAALFVHGVPLNGYHWRGVLERLSPLRRCIAPDLMGLGHSAVGPEQDLSFRAQARMLIGLMDALGLGRVDLVGNDSGGAIAQILAATAPEGIRSLVLTNCDTEGACPPPALAGTMETARAGKLGDLLAAALANPELARSPAGFGATLEHPEQLSDETIRTYLVPLTATAERRAMVDRYFASIEPAQMEGVEAQLARFAAPTLIVWGDDDIFFPVSEAERLATLIPTAAPPHILAGARLFFAEERADELCALIASHWATALAPAG